MNAQVNISDSRKQNASDFMDGQRDCFEGLAHKDDRGEDYDSGYSLQYALEQMISQGVN